MTGRTFAIGDIHGDADALERLLGRLPALTSDDSLVFLGDYVDRGPDSLRVLERVRGLATESPARVVHLRGNHEDMWIECFEAPNLGFLLPRSNGCVDTYRSLTGQAPLPPDEPLEPEEMQRFIAVSTWMPRAWIDWMASLAFWYEDEHAIYVHAGLQGEGTTWKHPRDCAHKPLMWMREPGFFRNYQGKRLIFGHTKVSDLPRDHLHAVARFFDDPTDVWVRGDLIGLDTACGKGGYLSAVELPRMKVYDSR